MTGKDMSYPEFLKKKTAPSPAKKKVMTKSQAAKKAKSGADMGAPGKNFEKIEAKAGKEYGSAAAGARVARSIFQNMRKKGKL